MEIRAMEIRGMQIDSAQIRIAQVRLGLWVRAFPLVPRLASLSEQSQQILIGHTSPFLGTSRSFSCKSQHYEGFTHLTSQARAYSPSALMVKRGLRSKLTRQMPMCASKLSQKYGRDCSPDRRMNKRAFWQA